MKKIIYTLLLLSIFWSCSTEKNAFLNKKYHYFTVKYNGFFNGNEAYKLAVKNIANRHKDDYDDLLDVFQYGNSYENKEEFANLDRAITKGAKMIDRHSMPFKVKSEEVEFNQMIDDCYLLIGKARFLKYDLESARETFLYTKNSFEKGDERYKASLWLIMTYIYQENFVDAETSIKAIQEDKDFPENLKDELALIEAISLKRSGQLEKAIPAFEKAISVTKKRKLKRRLQFILAQLNQKQGDTSKASALYQLIAKKATNYDLQFNAKINLATTYDGDGSDVILILEKMLKDAKNKEYQDQIYFALAKVYEKQGKEELAIKNYKLSAKTSVNNKKQKGKAFLALGDYYFDQPDYLNASNYYDSSLISLPKNFPSYDEINAKKESLKDLVLHLKVIEEQDSLLKIAGMSEEERVNFIEQKINDAKQKADEKAVLAEVARERIITESGLMGMTGSTWVFENPSLLSSGLAEFKNTWGDRPLEDNWRRSDKTSVSFGDDAEVQDEEIQELDDTPEDQKEAFYLKGLPFNVDQQEIANQKIMNSYYQLGVIYRDNFNDLPNSNFYFEKLNNRYPKNTKEAITLYQLYRNYEKLNKPVKKEEKKQKLVNDYAETEYAQLLLNPNMLADQEQKKQAQEQKYEAVFKSFKQENYAGVINEVNAFKSELSEGELAAKFDLIHAFSKGNLLGRDTLEFYLRKAYQDNMGTEVATEIDVILGGFDRKKQVANKAKLDSLEKEKEFVLSENEPHYFVIIFGNEVNKTSDILNKVSDFNKQFYSSKKLKSKSIAWTNKEDVIVVKPFKTNKESGDYYKTIQDKVIKKNGNLGDVHFMISKSNYSKLFQYKEVVKYVDFYKKNYTPRK